MPIYEYRCTRCGHEFEELVFGEATPSCPACQAQETEKRLSRPCRSVSRGAGVDPAAYAQGASCGSGAGGCSGGCGGGCAGCAGCR